MIPAVCARDIRIAARARIAELGITYETVDEIAGFTVRYTSKLLSEPPQKVFSLQSMFALLGAIALTPTLQHDAKRLERLKKRPEWTAPKLNGPQYRLKKRSGATHVQVHFKLSTGFMAAIGARGGKARREKIGKRRARQSARKAAQARWSKKNDEASSSTLAVSTGVVDRAS